MEFIYYCAVENVSVADGELISIENYFGRNVNFKINALTEEELKNIKLLDTELEKYKLAGYEISHIIFLYFYTCRFNIDVYMSCDISNSIGYFLWFFNKELPLIPNKNQELINLIKKINDKIGRLKDKKIFYPSNKQTDLKFYKFSDKFLSKFCKEKKRLI
jgi:hypothetical protein